MRVGYAPVLVVALKLPGSPPGKGGSLGGAVRGRGKGSRLQRRPSTSAPNSGGKPRSDGPGGGADVPEEDAPSDSLREGALTSLDCEVR